MNAFPLVIVSGMNMENYLDMSLSTYIENGIDQ
jgi:hypothetical protein